MSSSASATGRATGPEDARESAEGCDKAVLRQTWANQGQRDSAPVDRDDPSSACSGAGPKAAAEVGDRATKNHWAPGQTGVNNGE
jgi:hypothetical protein